MEPLERRKQLRYMRQQQQQADDTSGTAASSADPLVLCWRESRLSEKLFARPEEENILLHAYERLRKTTRRSEAVNCSNADSRQPSTVVWMPSSQAGLGQTTLVQSLQRKVHRDGGSFLYIQCDKGCEPDPHAPIVKALSRWASSCHASTSRNSARDISRLAERLEQGLTQKERGFLSDTVPEFKKLLKSTCSESTASLYSWKKRANLLQRSFAKLTYALAGTERPHVLVLEDLHLGNEVILDMLSCLLRAQDLRDFERPFLLVVTYRQDPDLYMSTCIDQLKNRLRRSQIEQMMIRLEAFTPDVLGSRMNEYMDVEDAAAVEALCRDGVPFLVEKRLENLASEQMLTLDVSMNIWTLHSDAQKHSSLPCTLTFCLDTISDDLLQFLRIFACLGVRTSRTVLEESRASDVLEDHLVLAVDSGLIICSDEERGEFSFSHEAVRDVVYQGIPIEEQPKFHYQIAENLWLSFDIQELDEYLLVVMDHLQKGRNCIPSERRKAAAAQLCLRAGEQMAEVTAYNTAYYCFSLGIEMLPDGWKSEYRLCLALHTFACEVAYCIARFDDIHRIAGAVIANARSFNDALRVQISKIYTIGSSEDCHKSLQYGDALLAQIGKAVGLRPSKRQASLAYVRCYRRLKGLTNEKILRLPAMDDPEKLAAMQILNSLLPSLFSVDHYLGPIVIDQMIRLSLEHGVSALSGVAFGLFATFQCWFGDVKNGQRYGDLALRLTDRFKVDAWTGRVATLYYATVFVWRRPFREAIQPMRDARQIALACGDIEFALLNANMMCLLQIDRVPIPDLVDTIREYQETMKTFGQTVNLQLLQPTLYILLSCSGVTEGDFTVLQDASDRVGSFQEVLDPTSLVTMWIHYARMIVGYVFGDLDEAARCLRFCSSLVNNPTGAGDATMPCVIDGLMAIELYRRDRWKVGLLCRIRKRIRQLRRFSAHSPMNFLGKLHLVQAEFASLQGRDQRAYFKYTSSISLYRESGVHLQLGLANELAGKHFLRLNETDMAIRFLKEAERVYRNWGGHAKADHLVAEVKLW